MFGNYHREWKLLNAKLQDFQYHRITRYFTPPTHLLCLTNYEERKAKLILMDSENTTITTSMMVDLEPNIKKLLMDVDAEEDISEIDLFQSQYQEETGDCRILRQRVDLRNNLTLPVEVIANINATDCLFIDFFRSNSTYHDYTDTSISYVCKKHLSFEAERGTDYLIFRVIDYMKPFEEQEVFSLNLSFPENISSLINHEKGHDENVAGALQD